MTATDTTTATITGTSSIVAVGGVAAPTTHFLVYLRPSSFPTAGPNTFNLTATAADVSNSPQSGYLGTVHFTSTDGAATLPADYTFVAADAGKHVFSITLKTQGRQTVSLADAGSPGVTGTTGVIQNGPTGGSGGGGGISYFKVSAPAGNEATGTAFPITVTAADSSGQHRHQLHQDSALHQHGCRRRTAGGLHLRRCRQRRAHLQCHAQDRRQRHCQRQ